MKNLIILLLPLASLAIEYKPYPKCWEACSEEGNLYSITCPTSDPGPGQMSREIECECTVPGDSRMAPCVPADIPSFKPISSWKDCQEIAEASIIDGVINFRWQKNLIEDSQSCYLLKDCVERPPCGGPTPDSTCVSGAKVCDEAPPTTPNCPQIKWDINAVHWVCTLIGGDPINAYGTDGSPAGTICIADKKCPTWSESNTEVEATCNAEGKWVVDPEVTDAGGDQVTPESGDHVCECLALHIDDTLIDHSNTAFICDEDLNESNDLTTGNSCVLICDGHITMIINCFDGIWVNTFDDSYPPVGTADISCYPPVISTTTTTTTTS